MIFRKFDSYLLYFCILQFIRVYSTENTEIECDAISNTDFGRRFCFIRHLNNKVLHNVTFKPNSIADEKRELIFDNCTLDTMPVGIFDYYPYIKTVYGWHIQLKYLKKEIFQHANELTALDLSKNHLTTLDPSIFSLAKSLLQLDLSYNWIEFMHVDTFTGLERLNILNLDYNKIQWIPANCFTPLVQLKTIRLGHNSIKMIPVELFGQNVRLQNIYLNDNAIEWLFGEQTFRHLQHVNEFDLHNNPIVNLVCCVINAQSLDIRNTNSMGCYIGSRTKRILANNNRITFIDSNDASSINLEHVELANNRLHKMHNLTRFENIKYLDLTNNRIHDIGLHSFAHMHRLEVLQLQNSGLSKIHFGLFSHKSKLKILDISHNKLGHIDFRMFVAMTKLMQLHLDGNNLNAMDANEIHHIFPALTKIGISQNDWSCQNLASIVKHLESSGIAINSIDSTKNTENIRGIPCSSSSSSSGNDGGGSGESNTENGIISDGNVITITSKTEPPTPETLATTTSNDITDKLYYNQWLNGSDMHVIVRLLELKHDVQNTVQSANEVARKLDKILNFS